jgi:hypothetical protein
VSSHRKVVESDTLRLGEPDEDCAESIRVFAARLAVDHTDESGEPRNATTEDDENCNGEADGPVQEPVSSGDHALVEFAVSLVSTRCLPAGGVGADAGVVGKVRACCDA